MIPQRLAPFRGQRLELVRAAFDFVGAPVGVGWVGEQPSVVRRWGFDSVGITTARPDSRCPTRLEARGYSVLDARLLGVGIPPSADGFVVMHEIAPGTRLFTQRGTELVGERRFPTQRYNTSIATDGRAVLVVLPRPSPSLWRFDDWSLATAAPWPIERLREVLGEPLDHPVRRIYNLGDYVLVSTPDSLSRWTWDAELIDAWRAPPRGHDLVAWRERAPIVYMKISQGTGGDGSATIASTRRRGTPLARQINLDWTRSAASQHTRSLQSPAEQAHPVHGTSSASSCPDRVRRVSSGVRELGPVMIVPSV